MKVIIFALLLIAFTHARMFKTQVEEMRLNQQNLDEDYSWYTQRLDHFNPQVNATWQQRYYDIDQYWDAKTGPLFLYICGEGTCRKPSDTSFVVKLAKTFKGRVLALEHRFYGMSHPTKDWSTENLKFLTPDQGLADLAQFATEKSQEFSSKFGIPHRRWITVGGSYPGAMSAWFRYKYPHIAFGALSSSGVVEAIANYHQYDEQIYNSTKKSGVDCPNKFINATQYIEAMINNGDRRKVFSIFGYDGDLVDGEFYYFLGDIVAGAVQGGSRTKFCKDLMALPNDNEAVMHWLADYAAKTGLTLEDYGAPYLQNTTIDFTKNARQWTYQTCANLGYFQTPAEVGTPMRGMNMKIDFWQDFCQRVYGIQIFPDTFHWNTRYAAKNMKATKIIFTNGSEDPWKHAGITKTHDKNLIPIEIVCDDCSHCIDLHADLPTDAPTLKEAREKITEIMKHWIHHELKSEEVYPSQAEASLREFLE